MESVEKRPLFLYYIAERKKFLPVKYDVSAFCAIESSQRTNPSFFKHHSENCDIMERRVSFYELCRVAERQKFVLFSYNLFFIHYIYILRLYSYKVFLLFCYLFYFGNPFHFSYGFCFFLFGNLCWGLLNCMFDDLYCNLNDRRDIFYIYLLVKIVCNMEKLNIHF